MQFRSRQSINFPNIERTLLPLVNYQKEQQLDEEKQVEKWAKDMKKTVGRGKSNVSQASEMTLNLARGERWASEH